MTELTPVEELTVQTTPRPRDVQVDDIGLRSLVFRSRTWERLKFEVEYGRRRGTTANSYLISGEKTVLIDPPGESFTELFLEKLGQHIEFHQIDFIVTHHVNSNRMATLERLRDLAPNAKIVCSRPAANALRAALLAWNENLMPVRTGDRLDLGQGHELQFMFVPTPRWPDGLCTYDPASEILYTDKLFGAHLCGDALWDEQWRQLESDRRYYFDCLHAPQAKQVETALDQFDPLTIRCLAPGHGPLVRYSLSRFRQDYRQWCQQQQQRSQHVALFYASAYGNTAKVADAIAQGLIEENAAVDFINCELASDNEIIQAVEACDGFIIGSPTLGGHAPVQIQTALGTILANAPKTKLAGVFGSFGWSGEAIDLLEQKLRDGNYRFGFDPIRVRFSPTDETLSLSESAGRDFARQLRKRQKQQAPRQAVTEVQADRTAQALGRVIGSLCVCTIQSEQTHYGILTTWISQASFNPPGLMMSFPTDAPQVSNLKVGDRLVLNILKEGRSVRRHFSHTQPSETAFAQLAHHDATNGCQILDDALAYLECTIEQQVSAGDHQLVYVTVQTGSLLADSGFTAVQHRKTGSQY